MAWDKYVSSRTSSKCETLMILSIFKESFMHGLRLDSISPTQRYLSGGKIIKARSADVILSVPRISTLADDYQVFVDGLETAAGCEMRRSSLS